jgi:hypothetical protein
MKTYCLEEDLYQCQTITEKCKEREDYGHKLYASMCNMQWQHTDTFELIKNEPWTCSWRYAGGIIARILNDGDYMDWYCSGNEGIVDPEVEEDLLKLGWMPKPWDHE